MKYPIPSRWELFVFAAMAVICATVVYRAEVRDVTLSLLSIPVFVCCALMGMRRKQ